MNITNQCNQIALNRCAFHRYLLISRVNTSRPRQNDRHFADGIFKCIFLNENVRISMTISLEFVPKGLINNNPAMVRTMAWRRSGDKPLSEPMMVSLLTHISVTRPQWVKYSWQSPDRTLLHSDNGVLQHGNVITWKRFPHFWALCAGNPPMNKRGNHLWTKASKQCRALMLSLLLVWPSYSTNRGVAENLRYHDAPVMSL